MAVTMAGGERRLVTIDTVRLYTDSLAIS